MIPSLILYIYRLFYKKLDCRRIIHCIHSIVQIYKKDQFPASILNANRTVWINGLLAKYYNLSDGKLYKINFITVNGSSQTSALLFVHFDSIKPESNVVFVTRLCFFNLFYRTFSNNEKIRIKNVEDASNFNIVAKKMRISRIICPEEDDIDLSYEIDEFFSSRKLMSINDVFEILYINHHFRAPTIHFFKVIDFEDDYDTAFVISNITYIYQVDVVCDLVPIQFNNPCGIFLKDIIHRVLEMIKANSAIYPNLPFTFLAYGSATSSPLVIVEFVSSLLHCGILFFDCLDLWSETVGTSEAKIQAAFHKIRSYSTHCVVVLNNIEVLGMDSAGRQRDPRILSCLLSCIRECTAPTIVFICDRDKRHVLSPELRAMFFYEIDIPDLSVEDRTDFLAQKLLPSNINLLTLARQTNGFGYNELFRVIEDAKYLQHRTKEASLSSEHIESSIGLRNNFIHGLSRPIREQRVSWEEVGGLNDVKELLLESLRMNLENINGPRRSGVLLYGPPGCGKTLLAKALATEFSLPFWSIKGPELLNKYIGQSEANVRKVFENARKSAPCIMFFDELDSLAPERGQFGDSDGVADRIVSQLLSEMDSVCESSVFVLGATNRLDLLDQSLLMPGRFDKLAEVGLANDLATREKILRVAARNLNLSVDVDLSKIASECSELFSGADLHMCVSRAVTDAMRQRVFDIENSHCSEHEPLVISDQNFRKALQEISPSFSASNVKQLDLSNKNF